MQPRHRPHSARVARARTIGSLAALLAAESAAVALLLLLGRVSPFDLGFDVDTWSRAAPGDALAAALRFVALGAASWLWVVTVLQAVATLHGAIRHRPSAHLRPTRIRVAPRAIRSLVERAVVGPVVVGSVVAGTVGLGAAPLAYGATPRDPVVVTVVRDGRAGRVSSLPTDAPVASSPSSPPSATAPPSTDPAANASSMTAPLATVPSVTGTSTKPFLDPAEPRPVIVAPGDDLWELAAGELARARGIPRAALTDGEIAPYWMRTCDANRDRVASGDVDLIFPGETLTMPPPA